MTRREVLISGAWAALSRSESGSVRFGVRTPLPQTGLRERAELVRSLRYDGIELGPEWLKQPVEDLQRSLDGTGAVVSAIVGSLALLDTDAGKRSQAVELDRKRLEMARALGAGFVIEVPVFGPNRFAQLGVPEARQVEQKLLVAALRQLAPAVRQTGITLLLEPCNHKETHCMNKQSQAAAVIRAVDAPGFKILSDFYHMQIEETNIAQTLSQYGREVGYVHLADGAERAEPGSLLFDYRPGFRALKKAGFHGWLTVESKATGSPAAASPALCRTWKRQWADA